MADPIESALVLSLNCGGPEDSTDVVDRTGRHSISVQGATAYTPALEAGGYDYWLPINGAAGNRLVITDGMTDFLLGQPSPSTDVWSIELRVYLTSVTGRQPLLTGVQSADFSMWWFGVQDGFLVFWHNTNDPGQITGTIAVPTNELVTVAIARNPIIGTVEDLKFAVNGVLDPSFATDFGNFSLASDITSIVVGGQHHHFPPPGDLDFTYSSDTFYLDGLRWAKGESMFSTTSYTPFWASCGGDIEYDISDDGWWRTHVRTRELVTAFTSDFLRVGADAYQAGAADAAAWAVGKTPTEIGDELGVQTDVISAYDTRDAFDFGRHIGLFIALGPPYAPPFDATALNAVSGGLLYGWYTSFVDRFALTPATSLKFLTEYDAFTRVFNRAYRAGWEGGAAAIYDDAQANAEGTSKVYDTSLIVSPFDTVQYDQYVTAYDFAYGAVWATLNP